MRLTREVDTEYGPMLASPVHARTLEPGDLVFPDRTTAMARPWLVAALHHLGDGLVDIECVEGRGPRTGTPLSVNHPVLRVVGGRSSRSVNG